MKHRLLIEKIPKKLPKELKAVAGNDKKDDFKQERMLGGVAAIPIANTSDELADVDFLGYGDFATFLRIQDTFSHFSAIVLRGVSKKKEEQTAEMVRGKVIPNWLAVFGAPRIIVVDKDSRFTVGDFPRVLYRPLYSFANANYAPSSKFRGIWTSTRTFFRTIIDRII